MKKTAFRKGERRLSGRLCREAACQRIKRRFPKIWTCLREAASAKAGRQPLTLEIQSRQAYENIPFPSSADPPYLRDPHSKSLEPDCLSPHTFNYDTASTGEGGQKSTLRLPGLKQGVRLRRELSRTLSLPAGRQELLLSGALNPDL